MSIRPHPQATAPARAHAPDHWAAPDGAARDEVISLELVRAQRRHQRVVEQLAANGPAEHLRAVTLQRRWERRVRPARRLRSVGP